MAENDSNMMDLVLSHLNHPWGPPWTLATLGVPTDIYKLTECPVVLMNAIFASCSFSHLFIYSLIHASKKRLPGGAGVTIIGGGIVFAPLHIAL